ncbi:C-type natriuretic peptide-like [Heptranchias perlo]|uniref:C-type natriuretic peptide-like n=1 Tax=Heptranchias perlo TaxID=212740 RepID=UPI003559AF43
MLIASGKLAGICLVCLALVSARPGNQHRHRTLASALGDELPADQSDRVSAEDNQSPPAMESQQRHQRGTVTDPQSSTNRVWLRFFNDFMNNQKMFRGRTKKVTSKGCFGMKMDRIGSMSSLGC